MGRVKIKIKTLETSRRQATYAKRKNGILKKAKELSILCETDILLVMFSPIGKPSLACGQRGVEEIVTRYAQLTPQERAKRQLETLEALKKNFKKFDHDVNIQEVLGASTRMEVECLSDQIMQLNTELEETHMRLSYWSDPSKIESIEHVVKLENSLGKSLDAIRACKESLLEKQQLMLQETNAQIQNEMQIPHQVSLEQHYQPLSWNTPNEDPHNYLQKEPNMIPQREIKFSAGSSITPYSSYLSQLGRSSSLGELVSGQYSFPSYDSNLLASNTNYLTSTAGTNLQNPVLDTNIASWASASGQLGESIHSSQASACEPCNDTNYGVWGSSSGLSVDNFDQW